jgi:C-terminal processing protease CtpA/Prc
MCKTSPSTFGFLSSVSPVQHKEGYRIVNVIGDSPMEGAQAVSFHDVIVGVNGESVDSMVAKNQERFAEWSSGPLLDVLNKCENQLTNITIFNCNMSPPTRVLKIKPNREWGAGKSLIGAQVRFDPVDAKEVFLPV